MKTTAKNHEIGSPISAAGNEGMGTAGIVSELGLDILTLIYQGVLEGEYYFTAYESEVVIVGSVKDYFAWYKAQVQCKAQLKTRLQKMKETVRETPCCASCIVTRPACGGCAPVIDAKKVQRETVLDYKARMTHDAITLIQMAAGCRRRS